MGFDFNVDLPHTQLAQLLRTPRFAYLRENQRFQQLALNLCNDAMRKDGTLVLQYSCRDIVLAICYFLFKQLKKAGEEEQRLVPQPAPEPDGVHWYVKEGLEVQRCLEITQRVNGMYGKPAGGGGGGAAASSQPAASAATTLMPGDSVMPAQSYRSASVAVGSVAAGGGGYGADSAAAQQARADSSALQGSPSGPAASTAGVGHKRPAADGGAGGTPASKLARVAPSSSSAQPPPATGASEAPAASAPATVAAQPPPAAAAKEPSPPSEPEEGELEEGELPD